MLSRVRLFMTPWTLLLWRQAPLSMGFSRQEHWTGLPFPSPGDFPDPRIDPTSPVLPDELFTTEPLEKPRRKDLMTYNLSMHINQSSHHILWSIMLTSQNYSNSLHFLECYSQLRKGNRDIYKLKALKPKSSWRPVNYYIRRLQMSLNSLAAYTLTVQASIFRRTQLTVVIF